MSAEIGLMRIAVTLIDENIQKHVGVLRTAEEHTMDGLTAIEAARAHIATALTAFEEAHKRFEKAGNIITASTKEHMEAAKNTAAAAGLESSNNETVHRVLRGLGSVATSTDDMTALMERQTGVMIPNNAAASQYAGAAYERLEVFHDDCNYEGPLQDIYIDARLIHKAAERLQL